MSIEKMRYDMRKERKKLARVSSTTRANKKNRELNRGEGKISKEEK